MVDTPRQEGGFSIVELVVTLAIAGMAVAIVTGIYTTATALSDRSSDLLTANELAYAKLQEFENLTYEDIPVSTDADPEKYEEDFSDKLPKTIPEPHEAKVFISHPEETTTLKYVLVRVKYGSGPRHQVIEYGSLIQQGGIGR